MEADGLEQLRRRLRAFAKDREWEQFHSPKNLSMALIAEAAELVEHFQWLTQKESRKLADEERQRVALELADILIYLIRMADQLGLDLMEAVNEKIDINEEKYPKERVKGSSKKYTEY
ncbi:MAG: nucleotide pyrophosphohydrolase [bacterium]|nr:nucleotide pyrophosphohydrolase [bacterium]